MKVIILQSEDEILVFESLDGMFKFIKDVYEEDFEVSIDKEDRTISLSVDGENEGEFYYWETEIIK